MISDLILSSPRAYKLFCSLIGNGVRSSFVRDYVRAREGQRVLDIGCGTGNIIEYLPEVQYVGFDYNRKYIEFAKKEYGDRAEFVCARVNDYSIKGMQPVDIVVAFGLLHHVDDAEVREFFKIASQVMKPNARLVTLDLCYRDGQSWLERYLVSKDRGKYVRTEPVYRELASASFDTVSVKYMTDKLWLPYTGFIMECSGVLGVE